VVVDGGRRSKVVETTDEVKSGVEGFAGCVLMVKYVGILCHPYLLAWHDDEGLYNAFLVGTKVLNFSNL